MSIYSHCDSSSVGTTFGGTASKNVMPMLDTKELASSFVAYSYGAEKYRSGYRKVPLITDGVEPRDARAGG